MKSMLRELALNGLELAGAAVFCYGAWSAWKPLGYMVAGALLFVASAGLTLPTWRRG